MGSELRRMMEQAKAEGKEVVLPGPCIAVPRDFVEERAKKESFIPRIAHWLAKLPDECGAIFCFEGYDGDPRELFQVPEVCKFLNDLFVPAPALLRKMSVDDRQTVRLALSDVISSKVLPDGRHWTEADSTFVWSSTAAAAGIDEFSCETQNPKPHPEKGPGPRRH